MLTCSPSSSSSSSVAMAAHCSSIPPSPEAGHANSDFEGDRFLLKIEMISKFFTKFWVDLHLAIAYIIRD